MAPTAVEMFEAGDPAPGQIYLNLERIHDTVSTDFPGHDAEQDYTFQIEEFRKNFRVDFHHHDEREAGFSLVGLDASVANAFRRILIAEIPTLAVEKVYVNNNTSVIQDEVLAHRLGLIPFQGGREGLLHFIQWLERDDEEELENSYFDFNSVQLKLSVECTAKPKSEVEPGETDPTKLYNNAHVYAKSIELLYNGQQAQYFSGENAIRPVNPDILIAKLRPGQAIDVEMLMHKGVGSDHSKFSPVATASYRLLPTIEILKPILGKDAEKFKNCFSPGVISLEEVTEEEAASEEGYKDRVGEIKAVVSDPKRDTVSRECLRHPEFEGKVRLGRQRDHFIFSVETTGQWASDELFMEAVSHLKCRAEVLEQHVNDMVLLF